MSFVRICILYLSLWCICCIMPKVEEFNLFFSWLLSLFTLTCYGTAASSVLAFATLKSTFSAGKRKLPVWRWHFHLMFTLMWNWYLPSTARGKKRRKSFYHSPTFNLSESHFPSLLCSLSLSWTHVCFFIIYYLLPHSPALWTLRILSFPLVSLSIMLSFTSSPSPPAKHLTSLCLLTCNLLFLISDLLRLPHKYHFGGLPQVAAFSFPG